MEQILLRHNRPGRSITIEEYRAEGGFGALQRALKDMTPDEVQQAVIDSGLRGRGGAGFPTGRKWSFVPRDLPGPRYLVCNGDEMEPGTYKDRVLLEANPYLLIEGMALACYALGVGTRLHLHPARLRAGCGEPLEGDRRGPASGAAGP